MPSVFSQSLSLISLGIAGLIVLPLVYVATTALLADSAVWGRLWTTRVPELFFNTISLAGTVAIGTLLLGVSLAWFLTQYDFGGSRTWEWVIILPLAIPSYVLAYIYSYLLGLGGPLDVTWQWLVGEDSHIFSPFTFAGAALVMTLNTFPFVYVLARSAFLNFNISYEEVARVTGATRLSTFFRVFLPLIRPSLVAGLLLAILYVVSDFGAVSLLRYQTFTYAIYQQMTGRFDYTAASCLSLLLVIFALVFVVGERWFRKTSRFYQTSGAFRRVKPRTCTSLQTGLITLYLLVIVGLAFALPVMLLMQWTMTAIAEGELSFRFLGFIWNSILLSGSTATLALLVGTPLAYLACRKPTRLNMLCLQGAYSGYVLPGPVAALALLVLISQMVPVLYGTTVILVVAYLIHFLPAGLQAMESALHQVNPNVEEAARNLGARAVRTFRVITLPLVKGGFLGAWILVFIQCMKELPATLLLRPVGFDTLAIRVWLEASEELFQLAAPPALLIIIVSIPVVILLTRRTGSLS
ncbi:MAG: ABC transporter permease subunit [Nitrospirales bacterium]|nr:ABC transporter permease subunit [Nitrospirales bacterium]